MNLSKGQGRDSLNLAACHSCTLIPETSCEEYNTFLDRGVIVGTFENKELGFFSRDLFREAVSVDSPSASYKNTGTEDEIEVSMQNVILLSNNGTNLGDMTYTEIWQYVEEVENIPYVRSIHHFDELKLCLLNLRGM